MNMIICIRYFWDGCCVSIPAPLGGSKKVVSTVLTGFERYSYQNICISSDSGSDKSFAFPPLRCCSVGMMIYKPPNESRVP